jgi:hypothetical protein
VIPARYSLIRYIPDTARGEQLNIGILAWTEHHLAVELDQQALERVLRENPHLAKDALLGVREQLHDELSTLAGDPAHSATSWLARQRGYPVVATEDRHTTVKADDVEALGETVGRLLARIVRPRRRSIGPLAMDPGPRLERTLEPFVRSQHVIRDYAFPRSRTGIARRVDYFANHGANVALDFLKLALRRPEEIRLRADAEANKIGDISATNDVHPVVFCAVSDEETVRAATADAFAIIGATGAKVVTSVDAALEAIRPARAPVA